MAATRNLVNTSFRTLLPFTNEGDFDLKETLLTVRNMIITVNNPANSDIPHGINRLIADSERRVRENSGAVPGMEDPRCQRLYEESYDPEFNLEELKELPEETVGFKYYRFITDNNISPLESLAHIQAKDPLSYLYRRAYKLHDILHVVMGWDTSILGEVRIVSFSIGQSQDDYTRQMPLMALTVLFLHLGLKRPWQLSKAIRLSKKYRKLGERSPNHVAFRFEEHWDKTPGQVRKLYLSGG